MYLSFAKFGMLNSRNSISCLSCKVDVKLVSHQQGRKQMNWLQSMTKQQSLFSIILVLQNLYQLWPVGKKHRLQLVGPEAYHPEAFNFPYTFETMLPIIPDQWKSLLQFLPK